MKHLLIILVLISSIFLSSRIYAGGNYYWAGDKKVRITTDRSTLVIFFKKEYAYKNQLKRYRQNKNIFKTIISDDKRMVVIQFRQEQFKSKLVILKNLNLTTSDIEWYSFGYKENGVTSLRPTNRISFKLKSGFTKNDLKNFMEDKAIFDNTNFGTLMIKANKIDLDVVSLANGIYESGVAVYCLPDFIANITKLEDPLYSQQYYLNHTGQFGGFAYDIDIDAPEAWDITKGSSNIIVAVIDDGVEDHEDLKDEYNNSKIIGGFTPYTGGNGGPSLSTDGHAEACAGIIAASNNNLDVRGIAPNIKLLTVNIFATGTSNQQVADGISWASDNGADILSNSWGYTCNAAGINIPQITDAINYARTQGRNQKGCVVVFAAGNNYPQDKCGYGPPGYIEFPATVTGVLCVSGSNYDGNIASYSSRGSRIDVTALGGENDIRTLDRMGSNGYNSGNFMTDFGGTSAACPQVSGVAALILSVNSNLTEQQVRDIITSNATDMGVSGKDDLFGWGRVNAALSVAGAYSLANSEYTFNEGSAGLSLYSSNYSMTFTAPPRGDLSAGSYLVDRYYVDATIDGFATEPQGWYTSAYGFSWAKPNDASRYLLKETTSSSVHFQTVFYFIKETIPPTGTINKWAPFDPNPSNLRKYGVLGIPLVAPIISNFTQNPDPICEGSYGYVYSHLSQGNGNPNYTWTPISLPSGSVLTSYGSYCKVTYPGSGNNPMDYRYSIRCIVSNGAGSDTAIATLTFDDNCTGCPTLAFENEGELVDENPLLITSLSNPGTDVTDYYLIQTPVVPVGDEINFTIHEPQTEHTWLDQAELIEAKINLNEYAAVTEDGEIVNYRKPPIPFTITLNDTLNVTALLADLDSTMLDVYEGDILRVEINHQIMGGGGEDNMILGAIEIPPPKQIMGTVRFVNKSGNEKSANSGNESKFQNFGEFYFRPNMSIICKRLGNLQKGDLE